MLLGCLITNVTSTGGAYAGASAVDFAVNAGPGGDRNATRPVGVRGTPGHLRIEPGTMIDFRMVAIVRSALIPARVQEAVTVLEVGNSPTYMASCDAAVLEAEVGELGPSGITSCTWFVNKPSMAGRASRGHA